MIQVRPALDADPAAIARAQVAAWHEAYAGLIPAAYLADYTVPMRTERWQRILRAPLPGGVTVVGEVDGVVEGFASIAVARDEDVVGAELAALYVHPTRWGTGLGHALHEAALAQVVAAGHSRAVLWVLEENVRARSFYERHGWRPDGSRKVKYFAGASVAEVRLARGLYRHATGQDPG
ncbi:MAG: GNAT family N-acetyltransferase [Myxococcota bacterium]